MIIYNVTVKVESSIAEEWMQWMRETHIPEVIGTGCFDNATILRLLEVDETDGPTYAIQYHAASKSLYNAYIQKHSDEMRNRGYQRWGERFIAFRSVMQIVD